LPALRGGGWATDALYTFRKYPLADELLGEGVEAGMVQRSIFYGAFVSLIHDYVECSYSAFRAAFQALAEFQRG